MDNSYGLKGRIQQLRQRKAITLDLGSLATLASADNRDSFDVHFSPSGQVLQKTSYDLSGLARASERFEYDGSGRIVRSIEFDAGGREVSSSKFIYGGGTRIITTYAASGELTRRVVEEYERDLLLRLFSYDGGNRLLTEKTFEYADGKLRTSSAGYFLPDGTLYERWISGYDALGRIQRTHGLNAEDKPLGDGKYSYEYDEEGRESKLWSFNDLAGEDPANALRISEYTVDAVGNWIERREFHQLRGDASWRTALTTRSLTYYKFE